MASMQMCVCSKSNEGSGVGVAAPTFSLGHLLYWVTFPHIPSFGDH